ncbi:MAG: F0F1 ATP synthase subunit alpha, partial [Anaerolineae bacterium]
MPNPELQTLAVTLLERLQQFQPVVVTEDVGTVIEVGDGIARVSGLSTVQMSELVTFPDGTMGMAFNLEVDNVGIIIMGDYTNIREG